MLDRAPIRDEVRAEMDRARADFSAMIALSDQETLARLSNGTRWTNRQLLFHMLFGYLITRNLRLIVLLVSRLPPPAQRAFVRPLDAATKPFHVINFWGSRAGGRVLSPQRMDAWMGRVITSLKHHLDQESDAALGRRMPFPRRWDPYFASEMTLLDVYHYATQHFDHHRAQLTITTG